MSLRSMFTAAVIAVVALQALQHAGAHFSLWTSGAAALLGTAAACLVCYLDAKVRVLLRSSARR